MADQEKNNPSIEEVLDQFLERAIKESNPMAEYPEMQGLNFQTVNLLDIPQASFVGATGCGKTSRIEQWAQRNADKINFVEVSAASMSVFRVEVGGKKYPLIFTTEQAEKIKKPKTVLFIDDFHLIKPEVEMQLESMLRTRTLLDISESNPAVHLNDMYFVVTAGEPR